MPYGTDPNALIDVILVHSGAPLAGIASFDLNDGLRIDIGKYEHVLILAVNGGGTTAGAVTLTPKDSASQTGPEFPLDGTGGVPDLRASWTSAADLGSRQRVIFPAGRRQFLNFTLTLAATGNIRIALYVVGFRPLYVPQVANVETNLSALVLT